MNEARITPAIGVPFEGGFYAGRIIVEEKTYALIVAPKAEGEHGDSVWSGGAESVVGALSYCDGVANTAAMAAAGSSLAEWALDLRIGGHDDWYLPSQDELELCYRNLKPADVENWCYARSGINLNSLPQGAPYYAHSPIQTDAAAFRQGGPEAFDLVWYWSSTQHASDPCYAFSQDFYDGSQYFLSTINKLRARAVRRSVI